MLYQYVLFSPENTQAGNMLYNILSETLAKIFALIYAEILLTTQPNSQPFNYPSVSSVGATLSGWWAFLGDSHVWLFRNESQLPEGTPSVGV